MVNNLQNCMLKLIMKEAKITIEVSRFIFIREQ